MYLGDIVSLGIEQISICVINSLMYYTVMPLAITTVCKKNKKTYDISISSSLYFLNLCITSIDSSAFHNIIAILMLSPECPTEIEKYPDDLPRSPSTFTNKWNKHKQNLQKIADSILIRRNGFRV